MLTLPHYNLCTSLTHTRQGQHLDVLSLQYGWTPLHFAAATGQLDIILYLNDHGADIHKQDKYGRLPYHLAAQQGYGAAVETFQMLCVNPLINDNVRNFMCETIRI